LTEELDDQHAVAGIDPHKHTATISLVDARGALQDVASFAISPDGLIELLAFLSDTELVIDRIGVEGTGGLGRPVVTALSAAGYDVREVQANRTAERRRRRRRAKTDIEDAEAIAREILAHPELPRAGKSRTPDPAREQLVAVRDWRSSLVLARVRLLTEAEAVLVSLPVPLRHALPATSRVLPQLHALEAMTEIREHQSAADQLKLDRLVATLADVALLTARIKHLDRKLPDLLEALGCTLTELCGVGVVTAMELHVEIGDPMRFHSEAEFARWCGSAPVALSSGEGHGPSTSTPTRPRWKPKSQLYPAHRTHHPSPLPSARSRLYGETDRHGPQDLPRRPTSTQTGSSILTGQPGSVR